MGFQKVIASGELGSLSANYSEGVVSLEGDLAVSLGGGEAAGIAKFVSKNSIQIGGKQAIDLGLEVAAHDFPALSEAIAVVKGLIDAELSKA